MHLMCMVHQLLAVPYDILIHSDISLLFSDYSSRCVVFFLFVFVDESSVGSVEGKEIFNFYLPL